MERILYYATYLPNSQITRIIKEYVSKRGYSVEVITSIGDLSNIERDHPVLFHLNLGDPKSPDLTTMQVYTEKLSSRRVLGISTHIPALNEARSVGIPVVDLAEDKFFSKLDELLK